jgi:GNAT superfamily N-acetyltransferase
MAEAAIRPAVAGEAACLGLLARRSKAHWSYSADFIEACREELTYDAEDVRGNTVFVAGKGGEIVGFYILERISDIEVELSALFVEPEYIGCRFGHALITHAKETARRQGATVILIQADPNAVAFYQSAGGVLCGERGSRSISGRVLPLFQTYL